MKNKRFLIASGGTGGHFYPGFALGKQLVKDGADVLFIVRKNDPAADILTTNCLPFTEVDFMGLPRSFNPLKQARFIGKLIKALKQTVSVIRRFRPDVAVGTGGYVSFPLVFASHFMGVKTAVHDSNTKIGLANKACGLFTDLFMLGLPVTDKIKNSVLVSTPIRAEFAQPVDRAQCLAELGLSGAKKMLLVFGGSQGAKGLNAAVISAVRRFGQTDKEVQFVHITGERWYSAIEAEYAGADNIKVLPYAHEIYELIHAADAVVCRSGASTLAELIYCKKPAVLVPYPHAAANHQYFNAKILADAGCALLVPEGGENLSERLYTAMQDALTHLPAMRQAYEALPIPDPMTASQRIAERLENL